ncbi:MAG: ferrous iron transport protein A [Chitinispirillaceae bacterium]|nr:ferrous iron transport protein A [Chitinispirillaceae bacterium]
MNQTVSLVELNAGQTGAIVSIEGGFGMVRRLDALGMHDGTKITKVSGQWMRGPVVVRIGSTDVAIGYGMARRILVSPSTQAPS